jgi:hypothetical protein
MEVLPVMKVRRRLVAGITLCVFLATGCGLFLWQNRFFVFAARPVTSLHGHRVEGVYIVRPYRLPPAPTTPVHPWKGGYWLAGSVAGPTTIPVKSINLSTYVFLLNLLNYRVAGVVDLRCEPVQTGADVPRWRDWSDWVDQFRSSEDYMFYGVRVSDDLWEPGMEMERMTTGRVYRLKVYWGPLVLALGWLAGGSFAFALAVGFGERAWRVGRARRRLERGLCVSCGYPSGLLKTCPECGVSSVDEPADSTE